MEPGTIIFLMLVGVFILFQYLVATWARAGKNNHWKDEQRLWEEWRKKK